MSKQLVRVGIQTN